ncbi:MAG: transcription-repair coupling factor [Lachnospiraceae bacterium]|jgi:transcription-repair coupling factor (superfamily II helicase)|nr:transcription-repair coupling factor [Lachnospiraceae bacterium]
MNTLLAPLRELGEYEEIIRALDKKSGKVSISGCVDSQKLHVIFGMDKDYDVKLIVTYSDIKARELLEDCRLYCRDSYFYPAKDLIFYQADVHGNQLAKERIGVQRRILEGKPVVIVTTFAALMAHQLPLSVIEDNIIYIDRDSIIEEQALSRKLVAMGYEKNYQVEAPGQFSIRGGIVDIFDLTSENPVRIELWGDTVESMRTFDVLSQRSIEENITQVSIYPAAELILPQSVLDEGFYKIEKDCKAQTKHFREQTKPEEAHRLETTVADLKEQVTQFQSLVNLDSYINYFYEDTMSFIDLFQNRRCCVYLDEPLRIEEHARAVELEFRESMTNRVQKGYILPKQMEVLSSVQEILAKLEEARILALSTMEFKNFGIRFLQCSAVSARTISSYNNSFAELVKDLNNFKKQGYRVLLLSASATRAKRLASDLMDEGLTAFYSEDSDRVLQSGEIMTYHGSIRKGFEYPLLKFVVISETDIFGKQQRKKKKKTYEGQKIQNFSDLKVGDYVVHESHGLGVYKGIEKVAVDKVVKDYIKIAYRDGGNLYVLATGLDVIQKYASSDAAKKPKLNKLGTQEWTKTKSRVKAAVNEIAKDLVELYAIRQQKEGFIFSKDTVWQQEFEEMFPFEETGDQLLAIEATKNDMESPRIMDRLICGDVGYGKTEIAIRAAFKAVQDGKQVAYLVPTTILAQQHYNTFVQRMKDFPVRVEMMSRFRTTGEIKKTIEDLKKGLVDIVIGTHRLLSADVVYKDLGLLVIDEEQRFGVRHKEKIKQIKDDVDVLTLTATPIPRTLHMSLVGIRDMSVLEEAPGERQPIQTYVMEYNEEMVREAIVRELSRQGQVYYVYNRVNNIDEITNYIAHLVPEANVAFAHGQMKEHELEKIMFQFINGEIDVLVATTIIETGLDISNVNTMIIHDSDAMGLSQLYQLRGRVGRSNRTSYAFLMYKKDKMLKEIAEKRLQAIREFTDLGSGFKIAMKDLEIRGAGNLLGERQHGHMEAVGYDLYCKMLNEAVKTLKGMKKIEDNFDTYVDMDVDAFIPPEYIVNEVQKLEIYKRIASLENASECDDMRKELKDRFGIIPKSVENLIQISLIRVRAHLRYVTEIKGKMGQITFFMEPYAPVHVERLPKLMAKYKGSLEFSAKGTPNFVLKYKKYGLIEKEAELMMSYTNKMLADLALLYDA